jgi:hypothetical protein
MTEKMNNSILRKAIGDLNKITHQKYLVNSFDMGDSDKTQYGLVRKDDKNKTMDVVLEAKYTKREIYYHVQGYLIFSKHSIILPVIEEKKEEKKKVVKKLPKKKK